MNIREQIQSLSEDDLRCKIIIPLLYALGCSNVRDNCNPSEKGKDVIYIIRDHFLREKIWGAAIIKKGDISKTSLDNIHRQISDAIDQFIDPDDPRNKIQLHEILIITASKITTEAQKYIHEQSGKNFQNVHFINCERLEFLINQIIIEYCKKTNSNYIFNVDTFSNISGKPFKLGIIKNMEGEPIE